MNNTIWQQWDKQVNEPQMAYVQLNNLYLKVERGELLLTKSILNTLSLLVRKVYPTYGLQWNSFRAMMQLRIIEHWDAEIEKLPNFENC